MFAHERRKSIIDQLYTEHKVVVAELVRHFSVSIETIRRDLELLEGEGLLKRVHGGAVPVEADYRQELPFSVRDRKHAAAKKELAEAALRMVEEGQSIALDVSSTNTAFARELKGSFERLTVLTNSLPILEELIVMPHYTLIFAGGVIRKEEKCSVGEFAASFVTQFHIDTFFMSASGVSLNMGITDYGIGEIQVKKTMIESAARTIVLVDSSKFEQVSLLGICELNRVSAIVTDSRISSDTLNRYRNYGFNVVVP